MIEKRFREFRVEGEGQTLAGPALVFGDVARFGDFSERFTPGSVKIAGDVIANLQHDRGKPVARTGAGLDLRATAEAIDAQITLPDTVYGREARELVGAGILRGFSIEFRADQEKWDGTERIIERAEIVGLGIVDRPAYPMSEIAQRFASMHPRCPVFRRYWY